MPGTPFVLPLQTKTTLVLTDSLTTGLHENTRDLDKYFNWQNILQQKTSKKFSPKQLEMG